MTFAEALRAKRIELGMTQGQLANALYMPRSTITNTERGKRGMDSWFDHGLAVCYVLGGEIYDIMIDEYRRERKSRLDVIQAMRDFRMSNGLSQIKMARLMRISQASYWAYESNGVLPHRSRVPLLASRLAALEASFNA